MKAADLVRKKGSSVNSPEVKGKKSALIDWIGNRRRQTNNTQEDAGNGKK